MFNPSGFFRLPQARGSGGSLLRIHHPGKTICDMLEHCSTNCFPTKCPQADAKTVPYDPHVTHTPHAMSVFFDTPDAPFVCKPRHSSLGFRLCNSIAILDTKRLRAIAPITRLAPVATDHSDSRNQNGGEEVVLKFTMEEKCQKQKP